MNRTKLTVRLAAAALSVVGSAVQLGLVATALALSTAASVHAAAPAALAVRYQELDLARPAGIAVLYRRIDAAARQVCGDATAAGSRFTAPAWRACVAAATERAVAEVDRPGLTAYHSAHKAARN